MADSVAVHQVRAERGIKPQHQAGVAARRRHRVASNQEGAPAEHEFLGDTIGGGERGPDSTGQFLVVRHAGKYPGARWPGARLRSEPGGGPDGARGRDQFDPRRFVAGERYQPRAGRDAGAVLSPQRPRAAAGALTVTAYQMHQLAPGDRQHIEQ